MSTRHHIEPDMDAEVDADTATATNAETNAKQNARLDAVEPGMVVETTAGDLGERDISKPKVKEVVRDAAGDVEKLVVEKGVIFKKDLEVPADRVEQVTPQPEPGAPEGEVTIVTREREIDALKAVGTEELPSEQVVEARERESALAGGDDLLSEVEESVPTAEGLRRMAGERARRDTRRSRFAVARAADDDDDDRPRGFRELLRTLGPGFLSGMAGNDSSAVTSYTVNGATNGYGQLWLMLLATPLYQAVQYACAKVGRVTQRGFAELLREHYGWKVALPASLILIVANIALIASDLSAIGSGLQLLTGVNWLWFVVPVALALWYVTVYQNFGVIKKIFLAMSLVFVAYLITGVLSGANWGAVLRHTFVPSIGLTFASISSAVALLGATVSPYTMFWQVQGEKEQQRAGSKPHQLHMAALDIGSGTISGNLVAYFIIVSTSATLFAHHQQVTTAADAAKALTPLLGPFATYLFAIGLIGAGLVAIPVLLASTSYAVSGTFGWTASLWKKPWQSEGFYAILTLALIASLVIALLGVDPIQLMFWANVLQGVLSPVMVVFLLLVGNNRRIMRNYRLGRATNIGLVLIALLMFAATVLLFYGLATGHSG